MNFDDMPNVERDCIQPIDTEQLGGADTGRKPRILLLYGSLRERSFSRLVTEEAARILTAFGAETKTFNPSGCPCRMTWMNNTRKCRSYESWPCGPMAWCGAVRSDTAP